MTANRNSPRLATGADAQRSQVEIDYAPGHTTPGVHCTRVCFTQNDGREWIGSFRNGEGDLDIITMIDETWCLVVARGNGYVVSVEEPTRWLVLPVDPVRVVQWESTTNLLVAADFTSIAVVRPPATLWERHIFADELELLEVTASRLTVRGWDPVEGYQSVTISLTTGEPISG